MTKHKHKTSAGLVPGDGLGLPRTLGELVGRLQEALALLGALVGVIGLLALLGDLGEGLLLLDELGRVLLALGGLRGTRAAGRSAGGALSARGVAVHVEV